MTERDALYRAILVALDDDLPLLVLSDWLEEHGEAERVKAIREAVAHRLPIIDHLSEYGPARVLVIYRRGFVEQVSVTLADLMSFHEELFAVHPITTVFLSDIEPMDQTVEGYNPTTGRGTWEWFLRVPDSDADMESRAEEWATLPSVLWDALDAAEFNPATDTAMAYPSSELAEAALSRAAVKVGRKAAGLSELAYIAGQSRLTQHYILSSWPTRVAATAGNVDATGG